MSQLLSLGECKPRIELENTGEFMAPADLVLI